MSAPPCPACRLVSEEERPPGGVLLRTEHFILHAVAGPTPLAGWVVLTAVEHVRGIYQLSDDALGALGPLMKRAMQAQREALGAVHAYSFSIGDLLLHAHMHLVPRYADTVAERWGRGAFEFAPTEALGSQEVESALVRLKAALT